VKLTSAGGLCGKRARCWQRGRGDDDSWEICVPSAFVGAAEANSGTIGVKCKYKQIIEVNADRYKKDGLKT
jgi:hypothetical protein